MKPIPKEFRSDGFDFTLLGRQGRVALLAKTKPHHSKFYYEVVIVQRRPECTILGRLVPAHEAMPSSEDWGTSGWSPYDFDSAWKKFVELSGNPKWDQEPLWRNPGMARFRSKVGQNAGLPSKTMSG